MGTTYIGREQVLHIPRIGAPQLCKGYALLSISNRTCGFFKGENLTRHGVHPSMFAQGLCVYQFTLYHKKYMYHRNG